MADCVLHHLQSMITLHHRTEIPLLRQELLQCTLHLQCASRTLLLREDGSATRKAMEAYLQDKNIQIKKSMMLVSNEAVKQAIYSGIGVSIVPLIGLRNAMNYERVKIYPLSGLPISTQWNLVYLKGKELTPAQAALINFIQDNKQRIMQKHFDWAF